MGEAPRAAGGAAPEATTVGPLAVAESTGGQSVRPIGDRYTAALSVVALLGATLVVSLSDVPAEAGPAATIEAIGSVNQVFVAGASQGDTVELFKDGVSTGRQQTADAQGSAIFGIGYPPTPVPKGTGYTARVNADESNTVEVTDPGDNPPGSFYTDPGRALDIGSFTDAAAGTPADSGFGYLETRDGVTLSVTVREPLDPVRLDPGGEGDGPWPTVINYSGYTPSDPTVTSIDTIEPLLGIASLAGYATVGVNVRGTGCSGGAFAFFEPLQSTDGYDIVETVAAQPWSSDVGLIGISYSGISQLFVGQTQPPSLAAIAPLAVLADTAGSTLYPGGVLNNGFATDWAADRTASARPSGQGWAADRIAAGDTVCEDNQVLKDSAPSIADELQTERFYDPAWMDGISPRTFVDSIDVPTMLVGAWHDEQTGGHFPTLIDELATNVPDLHVILTNGTHVEGLGPDLALSLLEFFDLYVGGVVPSVSASTRNAAPLAFDEIFGDSYELAPDRAWPADHASAVAQYQAEDDIRVLWERGAVGSDGTACALSGGGGDPCPDAAPLGRFETTYSSWPVPDTQARELFLQPDGELSDTPSALADDELRGRSSYLYDGAGQGQRTTFSGSTSAIWRTDATFTWDPVPEGKALAFETDPLAADLPILGTGSVDLYLRSTALDVDVEVNLTELRPDGREVYIQSGWLRASHRAEAPGSTPLAPFHTHLAGDAEDLPPGEFAPMRVEVFPVAHVIRDGSRLRLTVEAPGGNRPFWQFDSLDAPGAVNEIAHSENRPSKITLPVVADPGAPAVLPTCPTDGRWVLRGQPCRTEVPSRAPVEVTAAVVVDGAESAAADAVGTIDVTWSPPPTADPVTGYTVGVVPTGEAFPVAPSDTTLSYDLGDGPPPADELAFVVTASYADGDGPPSNASVQVPGPHGYPDIGRNAWNVAALDWVDAYDIVAGYGDGTFRTSETVTRGQLVVWLWKMMGRPAATNSVTFDDTTPTSWFADALDWAVENGILNGYPDNTFRSTRPVTRAQLTMWLWQLAGAQAGAPAHSFTDVAPGAWLEGGLNWLVDHQIAQGYPDNTFRPNNSATRGQMAFWVFNLAAATGAFA